MSSKSARREQITEAWGPAFTIDCGRVDHTQFVLAELRAARHRARLYVAEIETIGVALKGGMIDAETAVEWLADANALEFLGERAEPGEFGLGLMEWFG